MKRKENESVEEFINREFQNSGKFAEKFRCSFIEPGIVEYNNPGGFCGKLLIKKPVLDKMRETFNGKPVINEMHRTDLPANGYKEGEFDGIVSETYFNTEDAYDWAGFYVWDEATKNNLRVHKYKVSCSYKPTKLGPGGIHNNSPYDAELLDGEYTHLAIVDNPRYEDVKVICNSNDEKGGSMFKMFFNNKDKVLTSKDVPAGAGIVIDGKKVELKELINSFEKKKQKDLESSTELNLEDKIEVDGKQIPVSELVNSYKDMKNEDDEDEDKDKDKDKEKEDLKNQLAEKDKQLANALERIKKLELQNDQFEEIKNSIGKNLKTEPVSAYITRADRVKAGYDLTSKSGGK